MRISLLTLTICLAAVPAYAKYGGGSGTADDPYQIATAADLIALGETPADYGKHFILTADIDLDPNLPGQKVFDRAVIAPDTDPFGPGFRGTPFDGVFDGDGHTIAHLTITGAWYVGLCGRLGMGAEVKNLGVVDVNITALGYGTTLDRIHCIGGLVGWNDGTVTRCYSTGAVKGRGNVGGLVGSNCGDVTHCHSTGTVSGDWLVGGLVGENYGHVTHCYSTSRVSGPGTVVGGLVGYNTSRGDVNHCYSTGAVSGSEAVGGFVGFNSGTVAECYSTGVLTGDTDVGGLVGTNGGGVTHCYTTGAVSATGGSVGGLVGRNGSHSGGAGTVAYCYSTRRVRGDQDVGGLVGWNYCGSVTQCYSTGQVSGGYSVGGLVGKNGYILDSYKSEGTVSHCYSAGRVSSNASAGGLVGLNEYGSVIFSFWDVRASRQATSAGGAGKTTGEMKIGATFLKAGWDFVDETANGTEDIWRILEGQDYPRLWWEVPRAKYSGGSGDPNDPYQIATVEDLTQLGESPEDYGKHFILTADIDLDPNLPAGKVFDEAVIAPDTNPNDTVSDFQDTPFTGVFDGNSFMVLHPVIHGKDFVGLFGYLAPGAEVKNLGVVDVNISGSGGYIGALAGYNWRAAVTRCYSTGAVSGSGTVGGLVGGNGWDCSVTQCYSTVAVSGGSVVGGLVGRSSGSVTQCYSTGTVSGTYSASWGLGGLVGSNWGGTVNGCYSTSLVSGASYVGGLVGTGSVNRVTASFWDIQTSGQAGSDGGTGKTTAEMQTASTFLDAGWDFVDETANGTEDIWWINEGKDYPRLWWEMIPQN